MIGGPGSIVAANIPPPPRVSLSRYVVTTEVLAGGCMQAAVAASMACLASTALKVIPKHSALLDIPPRCAARFKGPSLAVHAIASNSLISSLAFTLFRI